MDGVAEWVEDGRDFLVNAGIVAPDVSHGKGDQLCKGAWAIDPDAVDLGAEMPPPRKAVATASTGNVSLAAYDVARMKIIHVRANLNDFAHKFMTDGHGNRDGLLRPFVPLIYVNVGAANSGFLD